MRRPVIGVSIQRHPGHEAIKRGRPLYYLSCEYADCVRNAGGVPILLPPGDSDLEVLEVLDGLLLTGGEDIDPYLYAQEPHEKLGHVDPARDRQELPLVREAIARQLPVLAICRGVQVLNVALGGTLVQDLPSQRPGAITHDQAEPVHVVTHPVRLAHGSMIARLMGSEHAEVNSFHHQAVDELAPGLHATAHAPDGVIEVLEGHEGWVLGVQWHPELLPLADREGLFTGFVAACAQRPASSPARLG